MSRSLLACVFLLSLVAIASAKSTAHKSPATQPAPPVDGYKDFNAGIAAGSYEDHAGAIKFFTSALGAANLPAHLRPAAYVARAAQYALIHQYDAALADYTQALTLKPEWPDPYAWRCGAYLSRRVYDKALADCSYAATLQPDNWQLRRARALINARMGKYADALAEYTNEMTLRPSDATLPLERAGVYELSGDFDKALADTAAASVLIPKSYVPDQIAGQIYFVQGKYDKAIASDDAAIDKAPTNAVGYLAKGEVFWAMGRFDDAAAVLQDSLKYYTLQPYTFLFLSMVQSQRHQKVAPEIIDMFANAEPPPTTIWPVVQLYLGKTKPEELAKLQGDDPLSLEDIQCQVNFYVGEWYLIQADKAKAKRSLQSAIDLCAPNSGDRAMASLELNRIQ